MRSVTPSEKSAGIPGTWWPVLCLIMRTLLSRIADSVEKLVVSFGLFGARTREYGGRG